MIVCFILGVLFALLGGLGLSRKGASTNDGDMGDVLFAALGLLLGVILLGIALVVYLAEHGGSP